MIMDNSFSEISLIFYSPIIGHQDGMVKEEQRSNILGPNLRRICE